MVVQEFDSEGFWDTFNHCELCSNKLQLKESLKKMVIDCEEHIKNRIK